MMIEAVAIVAKRKISELPVVDAAGRPVGLIDVTDVVGLLPAEESAGRRRPRGGGRPLCPMPRPVACFAPDRGRRLMNIEERCQAIELILSDVDGVLTDGKILLDNQGIEAKSFHIRDGLGVRCGRGRAAVWTGLAAEFAERKDAGGRPGIELIRQGIPEKLAAVKQILAELAIKWRQVCYLGDDLPDLPVVRAAGLGVAVADACVELRRRPIT